MLRTYLCAKVEPPFWWIKQLFGFQRFCDAAC